MVARGEVVVVEPRELKLRCALIGTGIFTAVVSASFATYMVSTDHPHPMFGGIEHLMIFAQPSRGYAPAEIARDTAPVAQPGIDYTATGAIPSATTEADAPSTVRALIPERIIETYVLREVHDGIAIITEGDSVFQVKLGMILPNVGKVLAIEKRGGKWVIVTPQGLITDRTL